MTPIQPAKGRAKSRWPLPLLWSRSGVIQLKGDGRTPASTRRIVVIPLRTLAKRCMRLSPLLAAPAALLLIQGEAKAVLT
jgi:hypothetical protein